MTVIGKILTFLLFFLSIVFLGFAIQINMLNKDPKSKQSWYEVAEERAKQLANQNRDLAAKDGENLALRAEVRKLQGEVATIRKNYEGQLKAASDAAAKEKAEAELVKNRFEQAQVALQAASNELTQRREESAGLYQKLKDKDSVITDQLAKLTQATNRAIQGEVAANSLAERVKKLEKDNQELVRAIETERTRVMAGGPAGAASGAGATPQFPPPEDVRGIVTKVSPKGLVEISIGSDAGLLRGHTLHVFREGSKPQYIDDIQIVEVTPHQAVGKLLSITPQSSKLVQVNDQVASRIIPSK